MKHISAHHPWLLTLAAAALATVGHAACSEETGETNPGGNGGSTTTTTSNTGGTTSSSSSSSSSGTTTTTIECTANYSDIPPGECDLLQQDCPGGMGCEAADAGGGALTTACVSEAGLKETGQGCNPQAQECKAGLECVFNKCSPVCCGDNDEPCAGGDCNVNLNFGTAQDPVIVTFCSFLPTCDLFDPTHCDSGTLGNCYPNGQEGYAVCVPPFEPGGDGEPCDSLNGCDDNMACISTPGVCRYTCLLSNWENLAENEGGCPASQTCNNASFNIPDIGVCAPV